MIKINRIFNHPFFYRHLRGAFFFGLRTKPIRDALELRSGDKVLDVGCGTGDYSILFDSPEYTYLGADFNEEYIKKATKDYGNPYRQFQVRDILKMRFKEKEFTKALFLGVMHHLTDEQNKVVLAEINRITQERVVIMDLSPGSWNPISDILCKLDRGEYPRPIEAQCNLIGNFMDIISTSNYYVRSGILRYSLIVCCPRQLGVGLMKRGNHE